MVRIKLNKHGEKLFPWLADIWLPVYGFNSDTYKFLIWDKVINDWKFISKNYCEGE